MDRKAEVAGHIAVLREAMAGARVTALVLTRNANVAWCCGGLRSHVSHGHEEAAVWAVVTPGDAWLFCANIEAARVRDEEAADLPLPVREHPWWEPPLAQLAGLLPPGPWGADAALPGAVDLGGAVAGLRRTPGAAARARARALGAQVGAALEAVCRAMAPGETEHEIAARMAGALAARGIDAPVRLVATDERVYRYRHPLPTGKVLERYAMLVVCGRREGLVVSCTRLVHFGPPPDDLVRRVAAVARVDAALHAATRPGATAGALFEVARLAYARAGFDGEWQHHHQGGLAGYEPREWRAAPGGTDQVAAGQLFAWNPSVPGAKCEDTILVEAGGNSVLTGTGQYPMVAVPVQGKVHHRPGLLVR